jgi:L-ectoine synthase
MIVRTLNDARRGARLVRSETWDSTRLVLAGDGAGFSFHVTRIFAGTETLIWYKHHVEAVYCIRGEGEIETLPDGVVYPIAPGTMYLLDRHDRHLLRATSEMELACVFTPALTGRETHDEEGTYPAADTAAS